MNESKPVTEAAIKAALDGTWMQWMTNMEEFQLVPVSVNFMGQYGPKGRPERDARRRHREGSRRGGLATAAKMRALRMARLQVEPNMSAQSTHAEMVSIKAKNIDVSCRGA